MKGMNKMKDWVRMDNDLERVVDGFGNLIHFMEKFNDRLNKLEQLEEEVEELKRGISSE